MTVEGKPRTAIARRALCVALAGSLALLAACSSGGSTKTSSASSAPGGSTSATTSSSSGELASAVARAEAVPTAILQTTPLPSAPPKGKLIVYLGSGTNTDNVHIGDAIAEGASTIGWRFAKLTFDAADPATLQAALKNALAMGANAVAESGADASAISASMLAQYKSAGVPIVASGTVSTGATAPFNAQTFNEQAFVPLGKAVADWFIQDSGGKGNALVENVQTFQALVTYANAFKDEVKAHCPGCKISSYNQTISAVASGTLVSGIVSALRRDSTIKFVVGDFGGFVDGIHQQLTAAGLTSIKVAVLSGFDQQGLAAIQGGADDAGVAVNIWETGFQDLDTAIRLVTGAPGIEHNSAVPFQLITKDNFRTDNPNAPLGSLGQFEKLWQVPVTACTAGC